jgi:hypothetical protein
MAKAMTRRLGLRQRTVVVAAVLARRLDPGIVYRERGTRLARSWAGRSGEITQQPDVCSLQVANPRRQYFDRVAGKGTRQVEMGALLNRHRRSTELSGSRSCFGDYGTRSCEPLRQSAGD